MEKNKKFRKTILTTLLLIFGLFIFACNRGQSGQQNNNNEYVDQVYEEISNTINQEGLYEDILIPDTFKGVTIEIISSDISVISNDGIVTRPSEDTLVNLTIKLTYQGVEYVKEMQVIVLGESSEIPTTYAILLPQDVNGTVDASKTADIKEGEVITIRVAPNTGYKLEWLKLNGEYAEVINDEVNITVTSNVTVTVSFISESIPVTYSVTLPQSQNGVVSVSKETGINAGEIITIAATPNTGYKLEWLKVNGDSVQTTNGVASIIVNTNVTITVSFVSEGGQSSTGDGSTTLVWSPATEITTSQTYKFALYQKGLNQTLYLNGEMSGYYMATTENPDEAIDVTVVSVNGGYQLKTTIQGSTKYIEAVTSSDGAHVNAVYSSTPTIIWTWNDEFDTFTTTATKDGVSGTYYLGTYTSSSNGKDYNTFSCSTIDKASSDTSYVAHLYYQKAVSDEELSASQKIENIKEDINEVLDLAGSKLTSNIVFPSTSLYGSTIIWSTSDSSVISLDGTVNTALTTKTTVTLGYQIILDGTEYDFVYFVVYVGGEDGYIAYYNGINGQTGNTLKFALREIITNTHTKKTSYDDCKTKKYVMATDGNADGTKIVLFWSGIEIDWVWDGGNTWNREHVWPQSQGWFTTSAAGSDLHHIRPVDSSVNSSHGNNPYGIVSGGKYCVTSSYNGKVTTECKVGGSKFEPTDSRKGDTARIIFYLLTRYPESDSYSITKVASSMSMLLEWNASDPVDASETRRNEAVYGIQGNRNPFIDYPEFANMIWGTTSKNLASEANNTVSIKLNRVAGQYTNVLYF